MKHLKILILPLLLLLLVGCSIKSAPIIQEQQKQIDELNTKLASTTQQLEILTNQNKTNEPADTKQTAQPPQINLPLETMETSNIKIEQCKSEARLYAEDNKKEYSESEINETLNKACKGGSMECADEVFKFLNDSIEADKERIYEQYYSNCLSN